MADIDDQENNVAQAAQRAEDAASRASDAATTAVQSAAEANRLTVAVSELIEQLVLDRTEAKKREDQDKNVAPKNRPLYSENLEPVHRSFRYWSDRLQNAGLQLNAAIIAANWALWGSLNALAENFWALVSLGTVGLGLFLDLVGSMWLSSLNFHRICTAEKNKIKWQNDAKAAWDNDNRYHPFPFTRTNQILGFVLRGLKVLLPTIRMLALL